MKKKSIQFLFPTFITKEGKWFVAECPILNIATQGRTENEVKKNMKDLIKEYIKDPDTPKDQLKKESFSSLTYIPIPLSKKLLYGEI